MKAPELYAVLMAGGSGTRFWPASRSDRPKQYLPIAGGTAMLTQTAQRLDGLIPLERQIVVTASGQEGLVREALPELLPENLLVEPEARNTAACVAWASFEIARRDPDAVQVVLPADHVIDPPARFRETLTAGAAVAASSAALVTFGVRPTHPATGYGYIELGAADAAIDGHDVHRVERFVEKPELERAKEFLASGSFLWNAGIFAWTGRTILSAFETHAPEIHAGISRALSGAALLMDVYPKLPSVPVDVAILERAADVRVLPIDYSWNDVGSWAALADLGRADADGNWEALSNDARCIAEDSSGCVVYAADDELIALVGVEDLVVVRAGNATLVCPRDRAQEVKRIVERLKREGHGSKFL